MQGNNIAGLNERPITIDHVAEITRYSKGYLYQLVSAGKIPFHKRGNIGGKGAVRFYESEIMDWMRSGWGFSPAEDDLHGQADKILEG